MSQHYRPNPKEIDAVLALPGSNRYEYFIKKVADFEEAWGLRGDDGWALFGTVEGETVFPLWAAEAYASLAAKEDWVGLVPEPIPLEDLLEELLPQLAKEKVLMGPMVTPNGKGPTPPAEILLDDLTTYVETWYGELN